MIQMNQSEENKLISQSLNGDKKALEQLLTGVQDLVFNLSLRMLGMIEEAQDVSQDIMIKIITNLSTFRQTSSFSTWVYRLSVNHLLNYKKTFEGRPRLSFEIFAEDLSQTNEYPVTDFEKEEFAQELKLSCSNVMLQCLDTQSRCAFILGTMFHVDSKTAGEIMNITPESYRKKLSRSKQKMSEFMSQYCGLANGMCSCQKRVGHAIKNRRLDPENPEYSNLLLLPRELIERNTEAMETMDIASDIYSHMAKYSSPQKAKDFLIDLLHSKSIYIIQEKNN
jgi:RNA polymerase sigma factor (sigma-70 family)